MLLMEAGVIYKQPIILSLIKDLNRVTTIFFEKATKQLLQLIVKHDVILTNKEMTLLKLVNRVLGLLSTKVFSCVKRF